MSRGDRWTRDQLLIALRLYTNTPFGQLHNTNSEIIRLAGLIGRTPSALCMKAWNFVSLDPNQKQRGIKGLRGASDADRQLWAELMENSEAVAAAAEEVYDRLASQPEQAGGKELAIPEGPTEVLQTIRARRVHRFFAAAVYTAYEGKCALTGIDARELLNASHIIPWSADEKRRANPSNGILLNRRHRSASRHRRLLSLKPQMSIYARRRRGSMREVF